MTGNPQNTGLSHYEATAVVNLGVAATNDVLLSVGDGRVADITDVVFTPLADLVAPGAGTPAIITVGLLNAAATGEPRRRVSWRLDSTNTTMDLTAAKGNNLRQTQDAVADDLTESTSLSYSTTATPADAGGAHGIVYALTGQNFRSNEAGCAFAAARVNAPSVVTLDYTPPGVVGALAGAVEVRVLWNYADAGR